MRVETKVGLLFVSSILLVALFAYLLGFLDVFGQRHRLVLLYNFAGGIQEGSAVRAMGIRVGKVRSIEFSPGYVTEEGEDVRLKIVVDIDRSAWETIRRDSRFYINLAGVIGERYIEITPGSSSEPTFDPGDYVRGIDPPRIDQMLSQGFALAGKILEMVEKNEPVVTSTLDSLDSLVTNLNRTLVALEKTTSQKEFKNIMGNVEKITGDLLVLTSRLQSEGAEETLDLLHDLIFRLKDLDNKAIKKFLQEEGIRARLF